MLQYIRRTVDDLCIMYQTISSPRVACKVLHRVNDRIYRHACSAWWSAYTDGCSRIHNYCIQKRLMLLVVQIYQYYTPIRQHYKYITRSEHLRWLKYATQFISHYMMSISNVYDQQVLYNHVRIYNLEERERPLYVCSIVHMVHVSTEVR